MTLQELADEVKARLNLTSTDADTRIKRELNESYRRVTSAIGLITARRATATQNTVAGTATVSFALEKVERVYILTSGQRRVLSEASYDEIKENTAYYNTSGIPWQYAIERMGSASTTVILDPIPDGIYALTADGYNNATVLGNADSPGFASDFHDVLIQDVLRIEALKKDDKTLAAMAKSEYEQRLSDLKFFIVKSNSLSIVQGSRSRGRWMRRLVTPTWRW